MTSETRADSSQTLFTYENSTSRLKRRTDPKGQYRDTTYFNDDNVQQISYWSAATNADSPTAAWGVSFGDGDVAFSFKTEILFVWCVRGEMNADQY